MRRNLIMSDKTYYLGLDMGTNSVGWAVTDPQYNLLRAKGKDLWGIREFNEAATSVDRRTHRISRRRRQREAARIGLLKDYFHDAISAVDPSFFERLENSKYHLDDKDEVVKYKYSIFNDPNYKDVDYYAQYPTIYHLRKELLENPETHDVRLVFLALLNMFKHRGHFLNAGIGDINGERSLKDAYINFSASVSEFTGEYFDQNIGYSEVERILSSRDLSRTKKAEELSDILHLNIKNKKYKEYLKAICGLKFNAYILFSEQLSDEITKIDICVSDAAFDEKSEEILSILGDDLFQIIANIKTIYDIGSLAGIMKGYNYLSQARVAAYEKHKQDLKLLKNCIRKYCSKDDYNKFFNSDVDGSYASYVGSFNFKDKQRRVGKKRTCEDLYKAIKALLKNADKEDPAIIEIFASMENETFLPKQLTASNGVIPNQVHWTEMQKILSNTEKYLPFLLERDESNLTVTERILQLYKFQIPYYIGPVTENSNRDGGNGWVIRKEPGQVLPWNIEDKIDVKATSEAFISRMVRRCTYINGKRVLPKASLEYESFRVLNEINNLRIDGERIPIELKQCIYIELFQKGKKVTKKQLCSYLATKGLIESGEQVTGIDININNSLSTYGKFKAIFGEDINLDSTQHMIEDIVFWCTIYGDSKKFLQEKIEEKYADKLSKEQLKRILGFKFKDWGNLSKEFFELKGADKSTGEAVSIIRALWDNNLNLMELINSPDFDFKERLNEYRNSTYKTLADFEAEDLNDYYFSAPVRRMIWQTTLIIKELVHVLGCEPARIFVEMTRKPDDSRGRTISRKKKFEDLYKKIKDESTDWMQVIEHADESGTIRSKKMYLYLTQKGRCMYTGKHIDLNDLFNDNLYDIDHIYPRHFVKDDNIDNNLVLVTKEKNAHKSDNYPLEADIFNRQKGMWAQLRSGGFINEEKYSRLMGRSAFSDEQKAGFIARQLVETSQGTKGIAELLQQLLPNSKIVYAKAGNVSEFRHKRDLPKSRLINDFHHAHDAYLNIVVGNVYYVKFTQNPINFIKNSYNRDSVKNNYNLSRMFDWDVTRGEETAWIAQKKDGTPGTIATVKKMLGKNTPLMTRLSYEGKGGFANETLYSADKAQKADGIGYIPFKSTDLKMQDVTKYGGFTSVTGAYFFLVEHDEKKKRVRTIESIPLYLADKIEKDPSVLDKYCEQLGLVNFDIRIRKIKIGTLIKYNGYLCYITGKTGNRLIVRNAVNLCLASRWVKYIKKIEKWKETNILDDIITAGDNLQLYNELTEKFTTGIYGKRPNPVGEKLLNAKAKYISSSIEQQCSIIYQVLQLSMILGSESDLRAIGESEHAGKMLISKKLGTEKIFIINQSPAGLYLSDKIDLRTV